MEQEEPGQSMVLDQAQLLLQPPPGLVQVGKAGVAPLELGAADPVKRLQGRLSGLGDEVGLAVAEILREVEAAALGHRRRRPHRLLREPAGHLGG